MNDQPLSDVVDEIRLKGNLSTSEDLLLTYITEIEAEFLHEANEWQKVVRRWQQVASTAIRDLLESTRQLRNAEERWAAAKSPSAMLGVVDAAHAERDDAERRLDEAQRRIADLEELVEVLEGRL